VDLFGLAFGGLLAAEGDTLLSGSIRRAVILALVAAPIGLAPV